MTTEAESKARMKALLEGKVPVELAKGKLIVLIGSWVLFILIGILALVDLLGPQLAIITALFPFLEGLLVPIIILIVIAGGLIFATVSIMIHLLRKHGYALIKFSIIFFVVLNWVIFFVILGIFGWQTMMLLLLLEAVVGTVLAILYFTIWKTRLELAGGILTITGQVTKEEKELFVPGYLKVMFVGILSLFGMIIGADIYAHLIPPVGDPAWWVYAVEGCYFFLLFLYLYINTYFFNAITIAIVYIWYRKQDPTFHNGLAIATYQLPDIAVYAGFSAIIRLIRMILQSLAKKSGTSNPWAGGGFRLADGIIGGIWFYVNYFTLPSIVVEDMKATSAIKRSAHRLFDNWVDVLLKEWGVGSVFSMLQILIILLFAAGGALFGVIMVWIFPALGLDLVAMIVLGVILFLLISTLVSKPFLNLLNDVYLTFLFGFIIDKESKFKYENNLPKELNEKLKDWFSAHPPVLRCQQCFSRVPEGAGSCPKCGAPYP